MYSRKISNYKRKIVSYLLIINTFDSTSRTFNEIIRITRKFRHRTTLKDNRFYTCIRHKLGKFINRGCRYTIRKDQ